MHEQLVFDLPLRTAMGREDFFVSPGNAEAVAGLDNWANWPFGKMLLIGSEGSGKTHLAHVWAAMPVNARLMEAVDLQEAGIPQLAGAGGVVIEDIDRIAGDLDAETTVFHLHNALSDAGVPFLITARKAPERWGLVLPDLASRASQAGRLQLAAPDDALLMAVMMKLGQDRQMRLTPSILSFAVMRMERSFAAAQNFIAELDARALARKKPPSLGIAKAILAEDNE